MANHQISRREFILGGLTLVAGGCATREPFQLPARPHPIQRTVLPQPTSIPSPTAPVPTPVAPSPPLPLQAIARSNWAKGNPVRLRIKAMTPINRITVHHEGSTPVFFNDERSTAARLEMIRRYHTNERHWADIGYHYIIDRAGRLWQGRDLRYQGAHVKNHNPCNIGVMVLGNFNKQRPTRQQTQMLHRTLNQLMRTFRVPKQQIFTHQELGPTTCPGTSLQAFMVALRGKRFS